MLVRKILAVEVSGSQIAILTRNASLGEAVKHGSIRVDKPIHFAPTRAKLTLPEFPSRREALKSAHAVSPQSPQKGQDASPDVEQHVITGEFDGWDTTFSATPSANQLTISLKLSKDIGGFRAIITGDGYLSDFDLSSSIDVNEGAVDQMEVFHKNINGVMNFKYEVGKDTPGEQTGDHRIKLPAAISIPLYQYLEGLPLFLEISAAVIIKPAISGGKEYTRGAFRITFNGQGGFKTKEGRVDATGQLKGGIEFVESQNISALAPLGMVVGFAAPRIELSFGVSKIIKTDAVESAAKAVDKIADRLMKSVLNEEDYSRFKSSPLNFGIGKTIENAVKSDAAAFIEMVATSGMSHSGMSAIFPCTRTDLHFIVKVGASAQVFGQEIGETESEIFKKDFTRIDPPGTRQCEEIGQ